MKALQMNNILSESNPIFVNRMGVSGAGMVRVSIYKLIMLLTRVENLIEVRELYYAINYANLLVVSL